MTGLDDLLRRARRREPEALGELVKAYSGRLFGLLYRLTGSRDAAEDLLQETFLRVVKVIDQYDHRGKFEPWLFRIAGNLARDRARRHKRPGEVSDTGAERLSAHSACDSRPDSGLMRAEHADRLERALARLSDAEREIIVLRHYSELSFREIADLLGVPLGTALARAHRALHRLRDELGAED